MSFPARALGAVLSTLLAVVATAVPLAGPAAADSTTLCTTYKGCSRLGMTASGYAQHNSTMYWRMYAGHNCTNYAAYRMVKSGLPNIRPWSGGGNATNWGTAMSSITDGTPKVGAVAWWKAGVWPAGSSGHVAYVEKVVSATEIIVSQDSWGGTFSWARITKSGRGWPSGFVHFNDVDLSNTGAPTIAGEPRIGSVLTAIPGTWSPQDVTLSYQWRADGVAIPGATASTLELLPQHDGAMITVQVSAAKLGYPTASATSGALGPVITGTIENVVPPAVTGTPQVDGVVTASPGQWDPRPKAVQYQWYAGGDPVEGATGQTLTVQPELVGRSLSVQVTARKPGWDVAELRAADTAPVAPGTFRSAQTPTLSGRPRLGETLEVHTPTATPEGAVTYTWLRGKQQIAGAAGATYQPTAEDLGRHLKGVVTYSRPGYTPLSITTSRTPFVRAEPEMIVKTVPRRHRLVVKVRLRAADVHPVEGTVRVFSRRQMLAEVPLVEGRVRTVLRQLAPGPRKVRVRYLRTRSVAPTQVVRPVTIL